jgi:hypothetical protein
MAYVYRHIRLDKNEPFYIGIGSGIKGIYKRAYNKNGRNIFWKRIKNKTDYRVEILFDDLTWEEACEKEKEFIALYGRRNINTGILCNMTDGGEGSLGCIVSSETRKKLSYGKKGIKKPPRSEEHKINLSISRTGVKRGPHNEETKRKIGLVHKGKIIPHEMRIRISESLTGSKNKNSKIVLNLFNGIYYESAKEASFSCKINYHTLMSMLNGQNPNKTSFKYV